MPTARLRWAAIPLALLLFVALRSTFAIAAAGSASDPDEVEGFDIKSIYWNDGTDACPVDSVECITLGVEAYETFTPSTAASAQLIWDLDFNNAPATAVASDEACIRLKNVGGNFQAELYKDCGQELLNAYSATQPTASKAQFKIPRSDLQTAGLSSTATTYGLRVTKQVATSDQAPDTGFAQHCLGSTGCASGTATPTPNASASPTPTATPTASPSPSDGRPRAFWEQGVNAQVPGAGVLTINTTDATVALGSAPPNSTKVAPVGDVNYTNTLANGSPWSVTVEATSLNSGSGVIHFSSLKYSGGASIAQSPPGAGPNPSPNATEQQFGTAGTADPSPGLSYSPAVTIATASASIQGAFTQTGGTLKLSVPAAQPTGTYSGKLRYTIIG